MRHVRPAFLALAAFSLLACPKSADEGASAEREQPTPSSQHTKPAEPSEKIPEQPEPASKKSAPKPKVDEAKQLRKQLVALLNEGRAATKKGDYQAGMDKYREALAIDASDVAVLGELGWAAFQAGDLELAHRTTVQALKFVRDDKQRGMLLYNLGRIAEAREQIAEAIDDYRASLEFRPGNKTVQTRLDALVGVQQAQAIAGSAGGELEGPDAPATTGLEVLARDLGDLAAACKVIEEQRCEDYTMFEGDNSCRCAAKLHLTPGTDDSWGLLQLDGDDMSRQVAWFPAVKTDKGWTVFAEVLYTYNPGAFGIYEEAELKESALMSLLGSGTQLLMRVSKSRFDRDMGLNEVQSEDHEATIICARNETGAYCTRALITAYTVSREVEFPEEDGEGVEHSGLPFEAGFSASVEFVEGKLIVKWTNTKGDFKAEGDGDVWSTKGRVLPPGEHEVAALLGLLK
jgi:tetratricopeptide (TPR) repeat protein